VHEFVPVSWSGAARLMGLDDSMAHHARKTVANLCEVSARHKQKFEALMKQIEFNLNHEENEEKRNGGATRA
jgi:hypothetical protein